MAATLKLKGRKLIVDGVVVMEIYGNRGRDAQGRPYGKYGYKMTDGSYKSGECFSYFDDAVKYARGHYAREAK